jgi:hypothetical protein
LTAAACATGVFVVGAAAGGAQESEDVVVDCTAKTFRILLWPEGHPEIESVDFPDFPVPHIEVYTGKGKKYPESKLVGYIDLTGAGGASDVCPPATAAPDGGTTPQEESPAKTITCKLKEPGTVELGAASRAVRLFQGDTEVLEANLNGQTSALEFDKKACKAGKPPS